MKWFLGGGKVTTAQGLVARVPSTRNFKRDNRAACCLFFSSQVQLPCGRWWGVDGLGWEWSGSSLEGDRDCKQNAMEAHGIQPGIEAREDVGEEMENENYMVGYRS